MCCSCNSLQNNEDNTTTIAVEKNMQPAYMKSEKNCNLRNYHIAPSNIEIQGLLIYVMIFQV